MIWSRALWDIRGILGHVVADTIILEAQFGMRIRRCLSSPRTWWPPLAVYTNPSTANRVQTVFVARGIL
jgi:hypothetical protein